MTDTQLELSLNSLQESAQRQGNRRPNSHAPGWWFRQMRQIVDRAFDWQPLPAPRPEQIWFPGTHRQVRVNS